MSVNCKLRVSNVSTFSIQEFLAFHECLYFTDVDRLAILLSGFARAARSVILILLETSEFLGI